MDTYTSEQVEEEWGAYEPEAEAPLPRRARRQFFNRRTAALGALVTCAIGFYAGIRVEKSQLSNSTTSLGTGSGARAGARAGGFAGFAGRSGSGAAVGAAGAATGAGGAAAGAPAGVPGGAGGLGGAGGAGGAGVSFGTVSSVNGKTLYVTGTSGNTIKVKLTSSTKITKTQSVGRKAIRPGDTIVVTGAPGSGGSTTAASVTDSGNRSSGSGGSASSGSGGGGSGSGSAVGSLFSSGG